MNNETHLNPDGSIHQIILDNGDDTAECTTYFGVKEE